VVREMLAQCALPPIPEAMVLEVGCGDAQWLIELRSWGGAPENLHGIDLDVAHIDRARARQPGVDLRAGDACALPWPDETFDIVIQSTMFTSILDEEMREAVAEEMMRVLKPQGVIIWYDFVYDNPRNHNVRGIGVTGVRRLFPGLSMTYRRVTLAPPLARLVVPISETLANWLHAVPLLRTHIVAILRR
jgi:ubiquinone/menaquinone biosynthesis C-methylase UbiE